MYLVLAMVSNPVLRQVEDIQGQWAKGLQELSIVILLLLIFIFFISWFYPFIVKNLMDQAAYSTWLYLNVILLITSLVFIIYIMSYFWRLRNTPQFYVLFIKREEEQKQIDTTRLEEQKKIDTTRFFRLFLIPTGISIGLAFAKLSYVLYFFVSKNYWFSGLTDWWSFELNLFSYYPLIVVVCSCIILYYAYHIKPERIQRSAPRLLFVPLILSILLELLDISSLNPSLAYLQRYMEAYGLGSVFIQIEISGFTTHIMVLTALIVLLYLTYHIDVEHRKPCTLVKEGNLGGVIEEGVGILPKKVRVGYSYNIPLDLGLSKDFKKRPHGDCSYTRGDCLEVELQGVELKIDGEKRLKICDASPLLTTTWNCSFPTSGNHAMNLMINVVKQDNSRHLIFTQAQDIEVSSLLSVSWAPVFTLVVPSLTAVMNALKVSGVL